MTAPLDLVRLRGLVRLMAAERTAEAPELFEDAVQEGMIAAWEASQSRPEAEPAYYNAAARNGVRRVVRGRPLTGEEGRRGWQDAHDFSRALIAVAATGEEYLVAEPVDPRAEKDLEACEIRDAVLDAVESLDDLDRQIVRLRYWEDLGYAEIAERLGRPVGTLQRRWTQIVRPALRARLEGAAA